MEPKTIFVMSENGVPDLAVQSVMEGIREVVRITGLNNAKSERAISRINIVNWGAWFAPDHLEGGYLTPHRSLDWYLEISRLKGTRIIDSGMLFRVLHPEMAMKQDIFAPHYNHFKVIILNSEILNPHDENLRALGCAMPKLSAMMTVVGLAKYLKAPKLYRECVKSIALHELGHMFGLLPANIEKTEFDHGTHCTNVCIMRQEGKQGNLFSHTAERIMFGPFCLRCEELLRRSFAKK